MPNPLIPREISRCQSDLAEAQSPLPMETNKTFQGGLGTNSWWLNELFHVYGWIYLSCIDFEIHNVFLLFLCSCQKMHSEFCWLSITREHCIAGAHMKAAQLLKLKGLAINCTKGMANSYICHLLYMSVQQMVLAALIYIRSLVNHAEIVRFS